MFDAMALHGTSVATFVPTDTGHRCEYWGVGQNSQLKSSSQIRHETRLFDFYS